MDERGATLQTVIITSILALVAVGVAVLIYNLISSESEEVAENVGATRQLNDFPNLTIPGQEVPPNDVEGEDNDDEEGEGEDEESDEDILPVRLYAGDYHTCGITNKNEIKCWGWNYFRQLGITGVSVSPIVASMRGLEDFKALSTGSRHNCAITADKTVKCWGSNEFGQLGQSLALTYLTNPTEVSGLSGVEIIAAGYRNTCAATDSNEVWCWGSNRFGQLGIEPPTSGDNLENPDPVEHQPQLIEELTGKEVKQISIGFHHICVIILHPDDPDSEEGTIECWGWNSHGQLGRNPGNTQIDELGTFSTKPLVMTGMLPISSIATGANHTCGVTSIRSVSCWGANRQGQLGKISSIGPQSSPSDIDLSSKVTNLGATHFSTCVTTETGRLHCYGALAEDGIREKNIGFDVASLAVGLEHVCISKSDGTVECVGDNSRAQIGQNPVTVDYHKPNKVEGTTGAKSISLGNSTACIIVTNDNNVQCWGSNNYQLLGMPAGTPSSAEPVDISGLTGVVDISNSFSHSYCAIASNENAQNPKNVIKCRGNNQYGELGILPGSPEDDLVANLATIPGIENPRSVSIRESHACAITAEENIKCWGRNDLRQFGSGSESGITPTTVVYRDSGESKLMTGAKHMSAGYSHTCAASDEIENLTDLESLESIVWCWGVNEFGQVGYHRYRATDGNRPTAIPGLNNFKTLSAGRGHTCGITSADTVKCWGWNEFAQLGREPSAIKLLDLRPPSQSSGSYFALDLFINPSSSQLAKLTRVEAISAGWAHTCAIAADRDDAGAITGENAVYCWGSNEHGKSGAPWWPYEHQGSVEYSAAPIKIEGLKDVKAISAGTRHTCAIVNELQDIRNSDGDNIVYCWGDLGGAKRGTYTLPGTDIDFDSVNKIASFQEVSVL